MLRFTIALHQIGSDFARTQADHLDWFFQTSADPKASLLTLASDVTGDFLASPFQRLADHRSIYLDYQGEISGNRGRITPWVSGRHQIVENRSNCLRVRIVSWERVSIGGAELESPRAALERRISLPPEKVLQWSPAGDSTWKCRLIPCNRHENEPEVS